MKKILLVSGCSYTDPNFYSIFHPDMDCNWPMWPELLAEKLDMECVNLATSGAGNEYIYSTLLDYITQNDTSNIGLVMAAWSQNQRKDFQKDDKWTNIRVDQNGDVYSWMKKSLRYYLSFKLVCEQYNIKYKSFQMINSYKDVLEGLRPGERSITNGTYDKDFRFKFVDDVKLSETKLLKIISSYENLLSENFIGWPLDKKLGGFNMNQFLNDNEKISELDKHPNESGQKKIMEILYDRLG
jgi:hypothetical protein